MQEILTWAKAVLTSTPGRWTTLTQTLPEELLSQAPAPNEWPALACLQHLVDAERTVFPVRVRAFLAGQDIAAFNPDIEGMKPKVQHSPADLAAEFVRLREGSLSELGEVTPGDLARTANHAELGRVTLSELLHEWAAHDLMHTVQAERALMQPFIRGSGPWLPYFADHVAGGSD